MEKEDKKIRVWDYPIRFFHWSIVIAFCVSFITSESESLSKIHFFSGYFLMAMVVLRIIYGFIGSKYSKFSNFIKGPSELIDYIKNMKSKRYVGHNPLGGLGIVAILGGILGTTICGHYLSNDDVHWLEELHEGFAGFTLTVVVIHVLGVIGSSVLHKENLVLSMITGFKEGDEKNKDSVNPRLILAIFSVLCACAFAYVM